MAQFQNKVAIITGSGQGVGFGIAQALAAEGASIVLTGRTKAKLVAASASLTERGAKTLIAPCDVNSGDDLSSLVEQTIAEFGRLDILVNNAQQVPQGKLMDLEEENLQAGWTSGPLATFRLMKLAYPHLKETKGSIINLASTVVKRWDMSGYGGYAAVKEGIIMLTRAAACEWGPDGIRANVVMPHAKSPGLEGWMNANPKEAAAFQATIPLRRVGELEDDIGKFVAMLCSDASAYVSGQCIAIDGGQANIV